MLPAPSPRKLLSTPSTLTPPKDELSIRKKETRETQAPFTVNKLKDGKWIVESSYGIF